jgi:hypothetical protein
MDQHEAAFAKVGHRQSDSTRLKSNGCPKPYASRSFWPLGVWSVEALDLKAYFINHELDQPPPSITSPLIRAAFDIATTLSEAADAEGDHYGLGFAIIHRGRDANFLLLDWWAHDNIFCQLLYSSALDEPARFTRVSRPLAACVWEAVVIAHERNSWVVNMMGVESSPSRYLKDALQSGVY